MGDRLGTNREIDAITKTTPVVQVRDVPDQINKKSPGSGQKKFLIQIILFYSSNNHNFTIADWFMFVQLWLFEPIVARIIVINEHISS